MKTLITISLCLIAAATLAQTVVTPVNIGTTPNDGTGDPLRTAMQKLNANEANLNGGKLEVTNPVVHGTLTGDNFGQLSIGDTLNIGSAGTLQGFAHVITGPTHTWHTLDLTPGASGGAPGTPSSVIIHSPLSAAQMNATTFGDWNGFTGYEWQHSDGSFSLDKSPLNIIKGTFIGGWNGTWTNGTKSAIFQDGHGFFADGIFAWDNGGNVTAGSFSAPHGGFAELTNTTIKLSSGAPIITPDGITNGVNNGNAFSSPGSAGSSEQFGVGATATQGSATAIGPGAHANGFSSFAGGQGATTSGSGGVAIGPSANSSASSVVIGGFATGIGSDVAVGNSSTATGNLATTVGAGSQSISNSTTAVGNSASAGGDFDTVVGAGATATHTNSTVIGVNVSDTADNQFILGRPDQTVIAPGKASIGTNIANTIYYPTVGGATSWGAGTLYTNGPQGSIFRMDISSSSGGSGSANQVFFHYTNNAVGRLRQAFFTLASGAVNVQSMNVELDPGATFKIDTITSTGGSLTFLNQTISSR